MTREQEIRLRTWWLGELKTITGKLMAAEARRAESEKLKAQKAMGEYRTYSDIQDAYAVGAITDAKRSRLLDLLDKMEGTAQEDLMYRMKLDFLQEDYQHQKEMLERLISEGGVNE